MQKLFITALAVSLSVSQAWAEDVPTEAVTGSETCFGADKVGGLYKKLDKIKDSRRDSVDTVVQAYFVDAKTRTQPMALYIKDGDMRDDFIVKDDGEIVGFHAKTRSLSDSAQVCGIARADGKLGMGMGTDVRFKNTSGTHAIAEILDGVEDGKSHYKKMLPGPMAMFVPKMTHVLVTYEDLETPPDIHVMVAGETLPAPVEHFGKAYVIDVDALEAMGAESLLVSGGTYTLAPVPSIKKMKSLGFGPDEDESGEDDSDDTGDN